jgi:hypothetical protein
MEKAVDYISQSSLFLTMIELTFIQFTILIIIISLSIAATCITLIKYNRLVKMTAIMYNKMIEAGNAAKEIMEAINATKEKGETDDEI